MQVTLGTSSCNLAGVSIGVAGGDHLSEGARPGVLPRHWPPTGVGLAVPFEDLLSLDPLTTPRKVCGRKVAGQLGHPLHG